MDCRSVSGRNEKSRECLDCLRHLTSSAVVRPKAGGCCKAMWSKVSFVLNPKSTAKVPETDPVWRPLREAKQAAEAILQKKGGATMTLTDKMGAKSAGHLTVGNPRNADKAEPLCQVFLGRCSIKSQVLDYTGCASIDCGSDRRYLANPSA